MDDLSSCCDIVMHQRGDGDPGESAEVFVDPKTDMYLFCHFAPPFFPSSVFFGLCCFSFCRDAPFEKLVYILAVITAELVLRVFIQTAKSTAAAFSGLLLSCSSFSSRRTSSSEYCSCSSVSAAAVSGTLLLFAPAACSSASASCACAHSAAAFLSSSVSRRAVQNIGAAHQQL